MFVANLFGLFSGLSAKSKKIVLIYFDGGWLYQKKSFTFTKNRFLDVGKFLY